MGSRMDAMWWTKQRNDAPTSPKGQLSLFSLSNLQLCLCCYSSCSIELTYPIVYSTHDKREPAVGSQSGRKFILLCATTERKKKSGYKRKETPMWVLSWGWAIHSKKRDIPLTSRVINIECVDCEKDVLFGKNSSFSCVPSPLPKKKGTVEWRVCRSGEREARERGDRGENERGFVRYDTLWTKGKQPFHDVYFSRMW